MADSVLLSGGHVYSPADPFATAMLVIDGQVAWIGDDAGAHVHRDAAQAHVDLRGALVTPAFVDAHIHATSTGLVLTGLDLGPARSLREALHLISQHQGRPGVLLGHGWDETLWAEGRAPTRAELDATVGDRPAYLSRVDVHSGWVSSALVAQCPGIEAAAGYSAEGPLSQEAHHRVREAALGSISREQRLHAQRATLQHAASMGIASVHEMAGPTISSAEDLRDLMELADHMAGVEVVPYWGELGAMETAVELGVRGLAGDLFIDGALGSRTACLREPYADQPQSFGAQYLDVDAVRTHIAGCTRLGLQSGFHVIGDRAADIVVDALEAAAKEIDDAALRSRRHRLEHVEMLDARHITSMSRLGVVASVQPAFDAAWGGPSGMYVERLGPDRARTMNAFADMAAAGVIVAFGSDAPVTPLDPWGGVRAAAFHRTAEQRISVRAAFAAHTRGGRRAADMEHSEPGVLTPGAPATYAVWAPADLVVHAPDGRIAAWSTDPRSGTPGLPDLAPGMPLPECWLTVVHGRTVYDSGAWT